MLFLVQTTHDGAHCAGYHPELIPQLMKSLENREEIARQAGVKLHGLYSALPEHADVAIVEADSPAQVARFLVELIPVEQAAITMTALTSVEEMLRLARAMGGS